MSRLKKKINDFLKSLQEEEEVSLPQYITGPTNRKNNKIPKVLYSGPVWDMSEISAIIETVLSSNWLSSGENVRKFEKKFSELLGTQDSVMVNSGSSANLVMIAALKKYFNWSDNDEVIVSSVGFPTTVNAIIQNNLKPIFVDIDWKDLNWDLDDIERKITKRTVGIFSSPVLGNPYDIDRLSDICEKNNISMIGDNCDSLGTKWKNRHLSDYFVASSCSFYPAHHITTGEGGIVTSHNRDIIKIVDHKYLFVNQGYNLKPLDLQGAIGLEQLKKLSYIHEKRRFFKNKIQAIFEKISLIRIPNELEKAETSWFSVPIICETGALKRGLVQHLESNGIQTRNYFAGNILMHPAYRDLGDYSEYKNACEVLDKVFFVGCSPNYDENTLEHIENVVNNFIKEL